MAEFLEYRENLHFFRLEFAGQTHTVRTRWQDASKWIHIAIQYDLLFGELTVFVDTKASF